MTPSAAPRMHLPTIGFREAGVLGRSVVRVLRDSNRTGDIIIAEEIAAQAQLGHLLECGTFDSEEGRRLLRDRAELSDVDIDSLRAMSDGTLGRAFADHLDEHNLSYRLVNQPTPYTPDPDRAYLLRRLRHSHDIWHTLLGIGTRGHEEVLIHAFSLAQTGLPTSIAIVVLGAIKHMVLEQRWSSLTPGLRRAYERGRRAAPLLSVYWEEHWTNPLDEVRARYRVEPW